MKSNKKRIILVLAILTMALVLSFVFVACDKKGTGDKTNSNDLGVYYEVVGSSLDKNSYIELKSGNVWYDGEDQGTFKINGGNITLYDGDTELMSGTISNGVLTLSFMGETTVYKKSGSMGSGNVDQKAMIKSIQNGKVDGLTVSLEIDNTVEDVDLSGMITTSKDCSWQLYTSKTATSADAIVTKIIVPKNGNNTYYIVVTSADGKINRTYTLNVWKNYYATLSFYANGTFYTSEQVLTHTTYGSGPSCSVAGYTFNDWGCDGYYVTESKSFNANLTPLTYTAKFDSNGGSAVSDKTATFNKDLSLPTAYKTGYTFLGWYINGNLYKDSIKYTYTNDVTFTARWQINSYNVVIKSENENCGTVNAYNGSKNYGNPVSLTATTNPGYIFVGWFANGTKISTNKTCTINVPAYNVTYVAKFEIDKNLANLKYSLTKNSCVITGVLDKNITTVLIPDYVTGISDSAFSGCTSLTSITGSATNVSTVARQANPTSFSANITSGTSIGERAFLYCTGLTNITLPNSVTSIGVEAFRGCSGLTSITIPDSVTSIGDFAFWGCSRLTNVAIPDSVTSIGERAFSSCERLTSVTIGNSVTRIGDYAFDGCERLTSIYYTGDIAGWCGISGLGTVMSSSRTLYIDGKKVEGDLIIPDSVTSIGEDAFYHYTGLTSVTIGNGVTSIGSDAFSGCTELTSINVAKGNTKYHSAGNCVIETKSKTLVFGCKTSVIPAEGSVTSIGKNAFRSCTGLMSITIPDSVTRIGDYAFYGCSSLTSITIPDSVTSIGNDAFEGCNGLTSVTIGSSVTSIGDFAFWGCYRLVEVYNKSTLSITAGSSSYGRVASYAKNVYTEEGGSKLSTDENGYVIYTDGDEKILVAYHGTNTELVLPSYITEINQYAFSGCSGLTSATIPDSVTSIGGSAFSGCTGLTSIKFNGTIAQWKAISKGTSWKYSVPATEVVCKDGTVSI